MLGTPYPRMNIIWNRASTQQFSPVAPQVPLYQPIQPIGKTIPQILVPGIVILI